MRDFEDLLAEIYLDTYIQPSKDWLDLPAEELSEGEFKRFKEKKRIAEEVFEQDLKSASGQILNHFMDGRKAFLAYRTALENGFHLPKEAQSIMKAPLDYSAVSAWERRHIKWQAVAQVLWFNNPEYTATAIQDDIKRLAPRETLLWKYLELEYLTSINNKGHSRGRGLEDVIKLVRPSQGKKGRPPKRKPRHFQDNVIVPIPKIYSSKSLRVNYQALKIALTTISKALALQICQFDYISNHPIIKTYKALAAPASHLAIDWWIEEAIHQI